MTERSGVIQKLSDPMVAPMAPVVSVQEAHS